MEKPSEEWRSVVGWEGFYEVSDHGRVRSLDRVVTDIRKTRLYKGCLLKPSRIPDGHQMVRLSRNGRAPTFWVHVLVAAAFIGPCPVGKEVCHNNGDSTDNRVENLRYDTHLNNMQDAIKHGMHRNARKEVCPRGHAYDRVYSSGRRCSICDAERDKTRVRVRR